MAAAARTLLLSDRSGHNFASRYDDFLSLLPTRGFRLYNSKENKKPLICAKDCEDFHSFHDDRCPRVKCGTVFNKDLKQPRRRARWTTTGSVLT